MSHPFEVGKNYRNRNGEYTVLAIEGDWMKIRYVGGGTLETRIDIQARIWENIHFERQMAQEEERLRQAREARQAARKRTSRAKRAPAIPTFGGFEESDFEPKARGIAWSSREELGKALAHTLNQRVAGDLDSWIVPRKSAVHVARKDCYDRDSHQTSAAFAVTVSDKGVSYGFHVGKPEGKVKAQGPWALFVEALSDNKVRRPMRAAMKDHDLSLDVYAMEVSYGLVGRITIQERGFLFEHETAEQEISRRMSWGDLAEYLQSVAETKRCAVHLRTRLSAKTALKAGASVSDQIADVFEALMPVYDASVGA